MDLRNFNMLLDKYHFYKRFKRPDIDIFGDTDILNIRKKYFNNLNIPFIFLSKMEK